MLAVLRRAAVAGSWYPATAESIAEEVDRYLEAAEPVSAPGRLVALLSPHAGLRYSGPVAAHGYALLRALAAGPGRGGGGLTVVLVGPSHRAAFDGVALQARGAWETPLGRVPIDEELSQALLDADPIVFDDPDVHRDEHSLEMQMPFLQRLVPGLRIVPMLMGTQSRDEVASLGGGPREGPGRAPRAPRGLERPLALPAGRRREPGGRGGRRRRWTASTRRRSWRASRRTTTWLAAAGRWCRS